MIKRYTKEGKHAEVEELRAGLRRWERQSKIPKGGDLNFLEPTPEMIADAQDQVCVWCVLLRSNLNAFHRRIASICHRSLSVFWLLKKNNPAGH